MAAPYLGAPLKSARCSARPAQGHADGAAVKAAAPAAPCLRYASFLAKASVA
jgi:hypothetical protein